MAQTIQHNVIVETPKGNFIEISCKSDQDAQSLAVVIGQAIANHASDHFNNSPTGYDVRRDSFVKPQ